MKLNKKGWLYPQQRILSLWNDVKDTFEGTRAPEPFFFRSSTGDTVEFWHTNLVPSYYELDDFQVRTPTDVLGQHIHLVKFDVTSSDGAGNGFNYEDGTFSPDEVRERIDAINASENKVCSPSTRGPSSAESQSPRRRELKILTITTRITTTFLETRRPANRRIRNVALQTTVQRWDTDPLLDNEGVDRTLRTVFTHDHFGPSTHQQVGLYAGLLVEPENSCWYQANGTRMNTRADGGPTSWTGFIIPADPAESYREFALEFQDLQLAYDSPITPTVPTHTQSASLSLNGPGGGKCLGSSSMSTRRRPDDKIQEQFKQSGIELAAKSFGEVKTPGTEWEITSVLADVPADVPASAAREIYRVKNEVRNSTPQAPYVYYTAESPSWSAPNKALGAATDSNPLNINNGAPFPELISSQLVGTMSMNYRSESVALRINNPKAVAAQPQQLDLAFAYSSQVTRLDPDLNNQPDPLIIPRTATPDAGGVTDTDPYTPLLRAYAGDRVQVRTLVGAHLVPHAFQFSGVRWHPEASDPNSGYRNAQMMGISEHFEQLFTLPLATKTPTGKSPKTYALTDYRYATSSDPKGMINGLWGITRAYETEVGKGTNRQLAPLPSNPVPGAVQRDSIETLAATHPIRKFDITAISSTRNACPQGSRTMGGPASWTIPRSSSCGATTWTTTSS